MLPGALLPQYPEYTTMKKTLIAFLALLAASVPMSAVPRVIDQTTGNFVFNNPVNTSITGEKQSIPVYCNGGLMKVSLMVNGYLVSNVKIYVK